MKIISPKIHAILDYLVAIFLIAAPHLLPLSAAASTFSIILGAIHFLLTIVTAFRGGAVKLVPFPIHGIIEFVVGLILGVLALTLFKESKADHLYYACLSLSILIVFLLTDYRAKND